MKLHTLVVAYTLVGLCAVGCSSSSSDSQDATQTTDLIQDTGIDGPTAAEGGPEPDQRLADASSRERGPADSAPSPDQAMADQRAADSTPTPGCTHPKVNANCSGGWCTIAAGCFQMGAAPKEKCIYNTARHQVTLSRSFEIQQREVTRAEFEALMGYGDGWSFAWLTGDHAQDQRSWHEAAAYCNKLSGSLGLSPCYDCSGAKDQVECKLKAAYGGTKLYGCPGVRLPTSAEWEYAYRAGTTTAYYNGENKSCTGADSTLDAIAWYAANSGSKNHKVGQKLPNGWGLYDVAGNVAEWTQDWIHPPNTPDADATDPLEAVAGEYRVLRGGNWNDFASNLRAASLGMRKPSSKVGGIRCVRPL